MWQDFLIAGGRSKNVIVNDVRGRLASLGLAVVEENVEKPWGAYFRLSESDLNKFLMSFYREVELPNWAGKLRMDPKILVVAPEKRLSWQYHHRRSEIWRVVRGPVGMYLSDTDDLPRKPRICEADDVVEIKVGMRHRLAGHGDWGVVAEIWVHTDAKKPSNEKDIVRLEDDFGR